MPLQTGQMLNNRYRIVRLLGQGGFGAVYRAWDANLNRPCAVKENLDTSPEAQRQFAREATILANLTHQNLPRVTDHFSLPGQGQYLVMDFVEGEDLASLVQRLGPVPLGQALLWITQVADALVYLHSLNPPVVHRDIKPANIRITPDGRAMLVDFGLVKIFNPQMKTTLGARAVTPGYAPPEQYGQGTTDARTDIYALGATFYAILTGQEPLESVQRMVGREVRPAHQVSPSIPVPISMAIEHSMRMEPSQRFQSASEFKAALTRTDPTMVVKPVPEAYVRPVARAPTVAAPQPKSSSRIGLWIGILAVGLLCFGGVLAIGTWLVNEDQTSARETSDAQLEQTLEQRVQTTSTAKAELTQTAKANAVAIQATSQAATATAEFVAQRTAQSVATERSREAYVGTLQAASSLVYGPVSDVLPHVPEDDLIELKTASVDVRDFIVEATFVNPFSVSMGAWDYGFLFRNEAEKNKQFRFVIQSDRTWTLYNNTGEADGALVGEGDLPGLDLNDNATNHVKLICQGGGGLFYLNGVFIAELDLSPRMNSGDIYIATGMILEHELTGEQTEYRDFTIWQIP